MAISTLRHITARLAAALAAAALLCALPFPAAGAPGGVCVDSLIARCEKAAEARRFDQMLANGRELELAGEAAGDTAAATIGLCYEVRSLVSTNDTVDYSAKIDTLKVRHERFKDAGDQVVTAKIAQTLGLYYHFVATAYTESLNHYLEALETHRSLGDTLEEIADLSSVAAIYLHKQEEPAGDYAAEAYREARESGNLPAIYVAAANMANFLCNRGDFDGALKYIGEATEVSRKLGYEMEETYLCTFMGSVYECMGKNQKAEEYYRCALATKEGTTRYDIVYARIKL